MATHNNKNAYIKQYNYTVDYSKKRFNKYGAKIRGLN